MRQRVRELRKRSLCCRSRQSRVVLRLFLHYLRSKTVGSGVFKVSGFALIVGIKLHIEKAHDEMEHKILNLDGYILTHHLLLTIVEALRLQLLLLPLESLQFLLDVGVDEVCDVLALPDFGDDIELPFVVG